jgi:hypothetical protein
VDETTEQGVKSLETIDEHIESLAYVSQTMLDDATAKLPVLKGLTRRA